MLQDPGNVWVAVGISMLSQIQAEIHKMHVYFRLMAAIFYLSVASTSESIYNSSTVLLDPKNVGVAAGISLQSHIQAEIQDIACVLPVNGGHLGRRRVSK